MYNRGYKPFTKSDAPSSVMNGPYCIRPPLLRTPFAEDPKRFEHSKWRVPEIVVPCCTHGHPKSSNHRIFGVPPAIKKPRSRVIPYSGYDFRPPGLSLSGLAHSSCNLINPTSSTYTWGDISSRW